MSITIIICEVETMKEPLVITMAREYASGGSEIAQKVADLLGIPLYNKELITIAAKKSGLTEEAIAASETQRIPAERLADFTVPASVRQGSLLRGRSSRAASPAGGAARLPSPLLQG